MLKRTNCLTKIRLVRLGLPFLCLGALVSCRPLFHRQVSSLVLAAAGNVRIQHGQSQSALLVPSQIAPGETITTEAGSRADLLLLPGIPIELAAATEFQVLSLRLERDGNESIHPMLARDAQARLSEGTLFAAVGRAQTRSRLLIETPLGTVSAGSGRTFQLRASKDDLWLLCLRGPMNFQPADRSLIKLESGQFLHWPQTSAAEAIATAPADVQAEIALILEKEKALRNLETEHRSDAPFR